MASTSPESAAAARRSPVHHLEGLDLASLRTEWRRHFAQPPPLRSEPLLRLMLAWRIQARLYGGIDPETRRRLRGRGQALRDGLELGAGTRLTRSWRGIEHEVVVGGDGFSLNGEHYASLSAVARAITGVRQNGPRFFGLREKNR